MTDATTETWLTQFTQWSQLDTDQQRLWSQQFKQNIAGKPAIVNRLFAQLLQADDTTIRQSATALQTVVFMLYAHLRGREDDFSWALRDEIEIASISSLAQRFSDQPAQRIQLFRLLAALRTAESIGALFERMVSFPPQNEADVFAVFEPFFSSTDYDAQPLFPRFFDLLEHPKLASAVIDLSNFVFREEMLSSHPISGRVATMRGLLGSLVHRLQIIEENPQRGGTSPEMIAQTVADSTALIISLCDSLALVGDEAALTTLEQAGQLKHRRIRVEAAAARIRLGDESVVESFLLMAADPANRIRVLKYAEELDLSDELDAEFTTAEALAESRLALWLAQPAQMGVAPTQLELIDQKTQFWPGYDKPVDCFLFRYAYHLGEAEFSNAGIVGPFTHAFLGNLLDLPVSDIYAAFAGWQAEHPEIIELDLNDLSFYAGADLRKLVEKLQAKSFQEIEPEIFASFFGQQVLVARAVFEEQPGIIVLDGEQEIWLPERQNRNPISAAEAWCIYKGRSLLKAFN
jgi:hypothetical protein